MLSLGFLTLGFSARKAASKQQSDQMYLAHMSVGVLELGLLPAHTSISFASHMAVSTVLRMIQGDWAQPVEQSSMLQVL